jgi:hypothetical protein
MTETQSAITEVLNAPRVQWKFNHDTEWQYGRPVAYTDQPSYIIEREPDGLRVGVLASFNPRPAPANASSGDVPENWEQVKELAKVLTAAAGFGSHVGVTEIAQAEAVLKHLATSGDEHRVAESAGALDDLPRDSVVMVENEDTHRWLAWKAGTGDWDVIEPRGDATQMTSAEVAALGPWQQLQTIEQAATRSVHDARGSREEVEVEGSFFAVDDLPDILARTMRALDEAHSREKEHALHRESLAACADPAVVEALGIAGVKAGLRPEEVEQAAAAYHRLRQLDLLDLKTEDVVRLLGGKPRAAAESRYPTFRDELGPAWAGCSTTPNLPGGPQSIEAMAPGTTFTAAYGRDLSGTTRWMRCTGPSRCVNVGGVRFDANAIDPSTIRDVTPPTGV